VTHLINMSCLGWWINRIDTSLIHKPVLTTLPMMSDKNTVKRKICGFFFFFMFLKLFNFRLIVILNAISILREHK
jgi:hypothetical protein